ncbi:MAG TPA: hypothetical protein VJO32_17555 [Ktedonobacteraceae bacterium]|nr:hypothetical protein [Ktedonobacteraceae bacterium]
MKTTLPASSEKQPSPPNKGSEALSWFSALKRSLRAALHVDRTQLTAFQAMPGTIGVVLPLSIGVATGHVTVGVSVAGGAALLGTVGLTYTYRARRRTLLLDCLGIALAAFVGSVTGHYAWLSILAVGIWGIGGPSCAARGQPAARTDLHFVVSEAKRIISSVNAINQLLSMSDESGRSSREKIVQ